MAERAKVCTDRILPRELMRLQRTTRGPQGRTRAISPIGKTLDEWLDVARAVHRRHRGRAKHCTRAGRLVVAGG